MPKLQGYTVLFTPGSRHDGTPWIAAQLAEMPSCMAEGDSEPAALAALTAIVPSYLDALRQDGLTPPVAGEFSVHISAQRFVGVENSGWSFSGSMLPPRTALA